MTHWKRPLYWRKWRAVGKDEDLSWIYQSSTGTHKSLPPRPQLLDRLLEVITVLMHSVTISWKHLEACHTHDTYATGNIHNFDHHQTLQFYQPPIISEVVSHSFSKYCIVYLSTICNSDAFFPHCKRPGKPPITEFILCFLNRQLMPCTNSKSICAA